MSETVNEIDMVDRSEPYIYQHNGSVVFIRGE